MCCRDSTPQPLSNYIRGRTMGPYAQKWPRNHLWPSRYYCSSWCVWGIHLSWLGCSAETPSQSAVAQESASSTRHRNSLTVAGCRVSLLWLFRHVSTCHGWTRPDSGKRKKRKHGFRSSPSEAGEGDTALDKQAQPQLTWRWESRRTFNLWNFLGIPWKLRIL